MKYSCLHSHSHFSLDGVGTIKEWIIEARTKGLYGLAITEHGNCVGMLELYALGKEMKYPVVLGSEFYVVGKLDQTKENKKNWHMTVLVKNEIGYRNICKLSSMSYQGEHFYYRPRITINELLNNSEGLIVCSGCVAGPMATLVRNGQYDVAKKLAMVFKNKLKDDFYMEIMPVVVEEKLEDGTVYNIQEVANKGIIKIAKELDIKLVATPDAHMPNASYKLIQDIKMTNNNGGKSTWTYDIPYYLPDADDFYKQFETSHNYCLNEIEQAFENTNEIVLKAKDLSLEFKPLLMPVDTEIKADSNKKLLGKIVAHKKRIDLTNPIYVKRLAHEIDTISDNGHIDLTNYFLLLMDLADFCHNVGILMGVGRGSVGGSLLAYALGITHVDPIKHGLLFSRFLNSARIIKGTLPDIDLDFSDRKPVIEYLEKKYGEHRVCKLGTITTLKLKSAIKDAMRAIQGEKFDYSLANKITQNFPDTNDPKESAEALVSEYENNPDFKKFLEDNKESGIMAILVKMLGQSRQMGVHASAIAITPDNIDRIIPIGVGKKGMYTQYTAKWCEMAGVIKFDILTVNTLMHIQNTLKLIKERHDLIIDPYTIPIDDGKVFKMFDACDTDFVFQFNSETSKSFLRHIKVKSIDDLSQITAIGRPGTMGSGMDKEWLERRKGNIPVQYRHPCLEPILKDTSGIVVYQEQLAKAFQALAGFTELEADDVRRATGKKDVALMQSFKDKFISGAVKIHKNITPELAEELWKSLETFAKYSFNKSHSTSYSILAYICQWFKCYYPVEWWCGVAQGINSSESSDKKDKLKELYSCAKEYFVLPDINLSSSDFYISDDNKIVCPFSVLSHIGEATVSVLSDVRKAFNRFDSFDDFLLKTSGKGIRKNIIFGLIWAGCFSAIEPEKSEKQLSLDFYDHLIHEAKGASKKKLEKEKNDNIVHINQVDALKLKGDALLITSTNVKDAIQCMFEADIIYDYDTISALKDLKEITLAGIISDSREHKTKKGETMMFVEVSNDDRKISLTLWPECSKMYKDRIQSGKCVVVNGSVNRYNGRLSIIVKKIDFI